MGTNGTHLICPYCARYQFHNWWMTVGWMGVPCRLVSKVGFKLMFDSLDSRSFQCKPLQLTWLFMHFQHTGIVWGQETGIRPGMGKGVSMHWQDHEFAQIWLKLTMYIYIYILRGPFLILLYLGTEINDYNRLHVLKWMCICQISALKNVVNVLLPKMKCFRKVSHMHQPNKKVLQKCPILSSSPCLHPNVQENITYSMLVKNKWLFGQNNG